MQLYNYGGGSFKHFFFLHILGKINSQFIGNLDSHVWLDLHIYSTHQPRAPKGGAKRFFPTFFSTRRPQVKVKVKKHHNHTRCRKPKQKNSGWHPVTQKNLEGVIKKCCWLGRIYWYFFWLKTVCWSETCWIWGVVFLRNSEYWIDGTSQGHAATVFKHCLTMPTYQYQTIRREVPGDHRFGYHPNDHKLYMAGSFRRNRSFRVAPFWIHKLRTCCIRRDKSGSCVFNLFNPNKNLLQRIFGFKINFGNSHHLTLSSIAYQ